MPINGKKFLTIIVAGLIMVGGMVYFFSEPGKENQGQGEIEQIEQLEVFDPFLLDWEEVKIIPPWESRDSVGGVVYLDKIWLMGGLNGNGFVTKPGIVRYGDAPHFSDIWVSEDGINWNLVTNNAPWGKRRSIQAVVFKDKIWVIPGWGPISGTKNDIWNSEDGINWNLIKANPDFSPREGHQLTVFQDKLWITGGVNYDTRETKNDVWYSEDGISWFEATPHASWSARWDHSLAVFQNKLWLIGGMDLNDNIFGDIWASENGQDWQLITDNPPWRARQGHEIVVFKDKLWIVGRFNDESQGGGENDIWFSEDGINWKKTKNNPLWSGREDQVVLVFKDKIWVIGGMDINWAWKNDIWFSK